MTAKAKETTELYDGNAKQRIPFEVTEGSERFETAHNVKPVTDARTLELLDAVVLEDIEDETNLDRVRRINALLTVETRKIWNDVIIDVENTESEGDFRELIDDREVSAAIQALTAVDIVEPETVVTGVRRLDAKATVNVVTRALFNGKLMTQTHKLRRRSTELDKKYDQINWSEDLKPSETAKAKAALYDEILVETVGFKGKVPIRFKTRVVDYHFGTTIDPKK